MIIGILLIVLGVSLATGSIWYIKEYELPNYEKKWQKWMFLFTEILTIEVSVFYLGLGIILLGIAIIMGIL
jgi:hypothetical protein